MYLSSGRPFIHRTATKQASTVGISEAAIHFCLCVCVCVCLCSHVSKGEIWVHSQPEALESERSESFVMRLIPPLLSSRSIFLLVYSKV